MYKMLCYLVNVNQLLFLHGLVLFWSLWCHGQRDGVLLRWHGGQARGGKQASRVATQGHRWEAFAGRLAGETFVPGKSAEVGGVLCL